MGPTIASDTDRLPGRAARSACGTRAPLVQCLTNTVVANVTANVLLALVRAPAMVDIAGRGGPAWRRSRRACW